MAQCVCEGVVGKGELKRKNLPECGWRHPICWGPGSDRTKGEGEKAGGLLEFLSVQFRVCCDVSCFTWLSLSDVMN